MEAGIPDKLFFKIGEVAALTLLRPSVLRYWETEFSFLKPNKSQSGQRLYSRNHLELILEIKRLLYTEKLTIEGARKRIEAKGKGRGLSKTVPGEPDNRVANILREVQEDLKSLRNLLQQSNTN
jgi:DNA-binding transcriptional MerR regulator